jgi:YgiT-type zinc finger domain-containing protein
MKTSSQNSQCSVCGGAKQPGKTTYSVDLGFGVVVVRNVPAQICAQCGEEWIGAETSRQLEQVVEDARKKQLQVEVVAF